MKVKFSMCLKLAAVIAVLAIAIIPSVRTSTASNQLSFADANLASEYQVIVSYSNDLAAHDKLVADTGKSARLVSADFDPLQRRSDDLTRRLADVQNAAGEIVRKLKAANEWNDLDEKIAANITDARQRAFFQENSFRQVLQESATGLVSRKDEIGLPLENLRKRLTSRYANGADVRIVRATYEPPTPVTFVSIRCSIETMRQNVEQRSQGGHHVSTVQLKATFAACHPGQASPF